MQVAMSARAWDKIDYSRVASVCMKNNKKHFEVRTILVPASWLHPPHEFTFLQLVHMHLGRGAEAVTTRPSLCSSACWHHL